MLSPKYHELSASVITKGSISAQMTRRGSTEEIGFIVAPGGAQGSISPAWSVNATAARVDRTIPRVRVFLLIANDMILLQAQ
jgi:hypothetical protein